MKGHDNILVLCLNMTQLSDVQTLKNNDVGECEIDYARGRHQTVRFSDVTLFLRVTREMIGRTMEEWGRS